MTKGTAVKLQRASMLSLLSALGWKTADKWKNSKIISIIPQIPDVAPTEPLPNEADAALLTDILAAIENGLTFEMDADEEVTASETSAGAAEKPKKEKKVKEPKPKKEKKVKEPKPKKEKLEGIRTLGRGYYAGNVIKRHGLDKGITEEMAQEVDALYGKPNLVVSMGALKWAYDAIRGFAAEEIALPEGYQYVAPVDRPYVPAADSDAVAE